MSMHCLILKTRSSLFLENEGPYFFTGPGQSTFVSSVPKKADKQDSDEDWVEIDSGDLPPPEASSVPKKADK